MGLDVPCLLEILDGVPYLLIETIPPSLTTTDGCLGDLRFETYMPVWSGGELCKVPWPPSGLKNDIYEGGISEALRLSSNYNLSLSIKEGLALSNSD